MPKSCVYLHKKGASLNQRTTSSYTQSDISNITTDNINNNSKNNPSKEFGINSNNIGSNIKSDLKSEDFKQNTSFASNNSVSNISQQNNGFFKSIKTLFGLGSTTDSTNFKSKTTTSWSTSKDSGFASVQNRLNLQSPGQNFTNYKGKTKDKVVSITYEEIGLFPRSFSRVFDRFFKQIFSDVENLVIQEYRFYRYLFLTTIQTIFILLFVPLVVNFIAKNYLIRPVTEYYWNTKQTEIFLNSYEQKRAFVELQDFEEKLYFESLLISNNFITSQANSSTSGLTQAEWDLQAWKSNSTKDFKNFPYNSSNINNTGLLGLNRLNTPESSQNVNNDFTNVKALNNYNQNSTDRVLQGTLQSTNGLQVDSISPSDKASQLNNLQAPWFLPLGMHLPLSLNTNTLVSTNNNSVSSVVNEQNYGLNNSFTPLQNVNQYSLFLALADSLQEKTLELAIRYNNHSIESITNFFADFISLITLLYLLVSLEIQINITKSFLLEVFFGLDDSKKSLLILIMTDLLVGYHSSNLWELFFQFIFNHYGIPESQTGIFLLVATLPVLLDVLFKYLIFRHLNRSSPATVATYHAIIE